MKLGELSHAVCVYPSRRKTLRTVATFLRVCFVFSTPMLAENPDDAPSNAFRQDLRDLWPRFKKFD